MTEAERLAPAEREAVELFYALAARALAAGRLRIVVLEHHAAPITRAVDRLGVVRADHGLPFDRAGAAEDVVFAVEWSRG